MHKCHLHHHLLLLHHELHLLWSHPFLHGFNHLHLLDVSGLRIVHWWWGRCLELRLADQILEIDLLVAVWLRWHLLVLHGKTISHFGGKLSCGP